MIPYRLIVFIYIFFYYFECLASSEDIKREDFANKKLEITTAYNDISIKLDAKIKGELSKQNSALRNVYDKIILEFQRINNINEQVDSSIQKSVLDNLNKYAIEYDVALRESGLKDGGGLTLHYFNLALTFFNSTLPELQRIQPIPNSNSSSSSPPTPTPTTPTTPTSPCPQVDILKNTRAKILSLYSGFPENTDKWTFEHLKALTIDKYFPQILSKTNSTSTTLNNGLSSSNDSDPTNVLACVKLLGSDKWILNGSKKSEFENINQTNLENFYDTNINSLFELPPLGEITKDLENYSSEIKKRYDPEEIKRCQNEEIKIIWGEKLPNEETILNSLIGLQNFIRMNYFSIYLASLKTEFYCQATLKLLHSTNGKVPESEETTRSVFSSMASGIGMMAPGMMPGMGMPGMGMPGAMPGMGMSTMNTNPSSTMANSMMISAASGFECNGPRGCQDNYICKAMVKTVDVGILGSQAMDQTQQFTMSQNQMNAQQQVATSNGSDPTLQLKVTSDMQEKMMQFAAGKSAAMAGVAALLGKQLSQLPNKQTILENCKKSFRTYREIEPNKTLFIDILQKNNKSTITNLEKRIYDNFNKIYQLDFLFGSNDKISSGKLLLDDPRRIDAKILIPKEILSGTPKTEPKDLPEFGDYKLYENDNFKDFQKYDSEFFNDPCEYSYDHSGYKFINNSQIENAAKQFIAFSLAQAASSGAQAAVAAANRDKLNSAIQDFKGLDVKKTGGAAIKDDLKLEKCKATPDLPECKEFKDTLNAQMAGFGDVRIDAGSANSSFGEANKVEDFASGKNATGNSNNVNNGTSAPIGNLASSASSTPTNNSFTGALTGPAGLKNAPINGGDGTTSGAGGGGAAGPGLGDNQSQNAKGPDNSSSSTSSGLNYRDAAARAAQGTGYSGGTSKRTGDLNNDNSSAENMFNRSNSNGSSSIENYGSGASVGNSEDSIMKMLESAYSRAIKRGDVDVNIK